MHTVCAPILCEHTLPKSSLRLKNYSNKINLIQNSQAVKKCAALRKAMVKKDVKSKVAAKKWL